MKIVQGWRAGRVGLGERTPGTDTSVGDLGSSENSNVGLLGSGVPVAGVEVSVLGISGVFRPDLLSLIRSRFLSFLRPC